MENIKINNLKYDSHGLIPTVVQEKETKEILMVAYSNKESLEMTIKNKFSYFWSRSKNKLWKKGETSVTNETERSFGRFERQFLSAAQYAPRYTVGFRIKSL